MTIGDIARRARELGIEPARLHPHPVAAPACACLDAVPAVGIDARQRESSAGRKKRI